MRFSISVLVLFVVSVAAAELLPVLVEVKKAQVYRPELYAFRHAAVIFNTHKIWTLKFLQLKSDGVRPPYFKLTINAGEAGFCPQVEFFRFTVNGISLSRLLPDEDDLIEWHEGTAAGAEFRLNYDGVRFIMRFFMTSDTGMLNVTLRPAHNSLEKIRSAHAEIALIPSHLAKKDGKVLWGEAYHRMVITPARTIEQTDSPVPLTEKDTYLIIQDKLFDGTSPEKGLGPSLIILNYTGIYKAEIKVANRYTTNLFLTLLPDFQEVQFSLFQHNKRISNIDFAINTKQTLIDQE